MAIQLIEMDTENRDIFSNWLLCAVTTLSKCVVKSGAQEIVIEVNGCAVDWSLLCERLERAFTEAERDGFLDGKGAAHSAIEEAFSRFVEDAMSSMELDKLERGINK